MFYDLFIFRSQVYVHDVDHKHKVMLYLYKWPTVSELLIAANKKNNQG